MRTLVFLLVLLGPALGGSALAASAAATQQFETGIAAYRARQYQQALDAFLEAQRQGLSGSNLDLNLGLAYYQLGDYYNARIAFQRVRNYLEYTPLADYQLGLVAAQMGQRQEALAYFESAYSMSNDRGLRKLIELARLRLVSGAELPRVDEERDATDVESYVLLGVGFDSNPALVNDTLDVAGETEGAGYGELSGNAELPIGGGVAVAGDVRARQYFEDNDFDEQSAELGLRHEGQAGRWRLISGLAGGADWFGGDLFQRLATGSVEARRGFGDHNVRLRYRAQRIDGGDDYTYLDGWRHRLGADWRRVMGATRLRLAYDLEYNDRQDATRVDGEFRSHSPLRNGVTLSLSRAFHRRLSVEWRARYRHSQYRDPHRLLDEGGTLREERRSDRLASTGLRSRFVLTRGWAWLVDYQYSRNDSSIERYGYDRHLVLTGIEWLR